MLQQTYTTFCSSLGTPASLGKGSLAELITSTALFPGDSEVQQLLHTLLGSLYFAPTQSNTNFCLTNLPGFGRSYMQTSASGWRAQPVGWRRATSSSLSPREKSKFSISLALVTGTQNSTPDLQHHPSFIADSTFYQPVGRSPSSNLCWRSCVGSCTIHWYLWCIIKCALPSINQVLVLWSTTFASEAGFTSYFHRYCICDG